MAPTGPAGPRSARHAEGAAELLNVSELIDAKIARLTRWIFRSMEYSTEYKD